MWSLNRILGHDGIIVVWVKINLRLPYIFKFYCLLGDNMINMAKTSHSVFNKIKISNGTCPLFPLGPSF